MKQAQYYKIAGVLSYWRTNKSKIELNISSVSVARHIIKYCGIPQELEIINF